jgi:molybdenum cofactor sulfurtransferase
VDSVRSIKTAPGSYNLFAFPFEDNFAGTKPGTPYLKELVADTELREKWAIIGDVAAFLPTNPLNLTEYPIDAAVLSFYKIIGYPNTGALIIRNDFAKRLKKRSYSSTSSEGSLLHGNHYKLHEELPWRLEDDEVPFQMNLAVRYGLRFLKKIGMKNIQAHVWNLTKKLAVALKGMKHSTGLAVAKVYGNHEKNDSDLQGGIVAFNLRRTNGSFFGYSLVVTEASGADFHLRGGCHCNPGACFANMRIDEETVKMYFDKKTTCGDNNDIVNGVPLGSVRASFGWASTERDVELFIQWIRDNFVF